MKARIIALLIVGAAAQPAAQESNYGLESRAAIGAHHICSACGSSAASPSEHRCRLSRRTSCRFATSVGIPASRSE